MSTVIKVENVSKQYRLGEIGTGTISHDLNRWWARVRGKEDPYLQIGESNDRTVKGSSDYVWALQDINFEVQQGEVLGIIGRNGAGKSTLLKILSKTTAPTTGSIKIKGRIASLLEVGTGFHPELSGRDNIFLNGAILGMTKQEIKRKFDEIVDFSGVERYIDTPVKRYSSGMYVRLAFAVAAHLENEILIVDEVLAVGDADFQKKCLGKMGAVSQSEGRTVILVSHNMSSITKLCANGVLLENGLLTQASTIDTIVEKYQAKLQNRLHSINFNQYKDLERTGPQIFGTLLSFRLYDNNGINTTTFELGKSLNVDIAFRLKQTCPNPELGIAISNSNGQRFHHVISTNGLEMSNFKSGSYECSVSTDYLNLYPGTYYITIWFRSYSDAPIDDYIECATFFDILDSQKSIPFSESYKKNGGVFLNAVWKLK